VVVPAYNYARYLCECAQSVLSQHTVEVELIIVDDCSTDETRQVTADLAAADSRVTVMRNDPNLGHIPSVNKGFGRVTSEYVVKLDADDLLAPGALARATALLEARPEVSFAFGRPQHFSGDTPRLIESRLRSWTIWSGRDWVAQRCRSGLNAISQPEVVMRAALLRRALPIRTALPHTSDLHLWMQLASMGDVGRINGPAQGYYRVHPDSMQHTVNSGALFDLRSRRDAFDSVFAAEGGALADAADLHQTARRALAAAALDAACRAYDRGRTGDAPVDGFVAFALETWPSARELNGWNALERRVSVGAERASRHPRFVADALIRRGYEEVSRRRWQRTGELGRLRWHRAVRP
jgi:hypothetical protein